jgi:hypothetical protein
MERYCSTGQSPQRAVVPTEEEEEEEEEEEALNMFRAVFPSITGSLKLHTTSGICQRDPADCLLVGTRWNCL